jgi:hypothetical protein
MSKRHQSSRRRTYGRRQHELHERPDRTVGILGLGDEHEMPGSVDGWEVRVLARTAAGDWLGSRGLD